jgi:hypothetical protein
MILKRLYFLALILGILTTNSIFSQNPESIVKVKLSLNGGKTVYKIGEPIKLILSYTADQPGYLVETYYSPLFDDVIVTPTDGIYDWLYRLNRLYSYDDVSVPRKLSTSPVDINLTINNLVRFDKSGKYKIRVNSKRVWKPTEEHSFKSKPIFLLSNEIEFEVKFMSEEEEQAEVKRISILMDSATSLHQHQIFKQDLDYLTGDVSTVEKVRRFLNPPVFGGVSWLDSGKGLSIARNKKQAITLLEDVFRDSNREVSRYLIGELVKLRLLMEDEQQPSKAENSSQLSKEREPRHKELTNACYAELIESLPKRNGRSQLFAAYTIVTSLPKENTLSVGFNTAKTLLLEKFGELKH